MIPADRVAPLGLVSLAVLKRRALSLGSANAFDYCVQFLLPVVLARSLDAASFGEYRLLWLAIITLMAVLPLSMPQSLYFFLPRADPTAKRLYVHQTMLYMVFVGLLGAWALSAWNPLLPGTLDTLTQYGWLVPALMALWMAANLVNLLPTIDERVTWQAVLIMSLSLLRGVSLGLAAYLTGDLRVLLALLVALTLFKFLILLRYVDCTHGLGRPWWDRHAFAAQFRHAAPFGVSSALYALRSQADQWVAAALFALHSFAAFSIAAVLGPLINLFRMSVNHAFLPSMSRLHASGDVAGMISLNSRANVMVAGLVYPLLAFAFVFAEEIVTLVYTSSYVAAAPIMRVYILALVPMVVEVVSITLLLKEGVFAVRLNLATLALAVAVSWLGAKQFGLPGAAMGSVLVIYVDRLFTIRRIAWRTGTPIRRLQDWRTLGLLLLFSALAAALAWAVTGRVLHLDAPWKMLLAGGTLVMAAYALLPLACGLGRGWLLSVCNPKT